MKGQILDFSFQTNSGVISGDDGSRFSFTGSEWQGSEFPEPGMRVDFTPDGNAATGIYVDVAPAGAGQAPGPAPAPGPALGQSPGAPQHPAQPGAPPQETGASPINQFLENLKPVLANLEPVLANAKTASGDLLTRGLAMARTIPTLYLIIGGAVAGVAVVAVIALIVLSAAGVIGGGNPQPVSVLDLAPEDATTVIRLDVQKILDEPDLAEDMDIEDFIDSDDIGIMLDEVSEIVMVEDYDGDLVILKGDFNFDDITAEWEDDDAEKDAYRGYEIWVNLPDGSTAAPLKGYLVTSHSERAVQKALKNLYNGAGSLEQSDGDNAMQQVLDRLGQGYAVTAAGPGYCDVSDCEAYGYVFTDYDEDDAEIKMEIALLFRNERAAERAAQDYDEIADFLEYSHDIDIEDTEASGSFVVGDAYDELW